MIGRIRHRGLKRLYKNGDPSGIPAHHAERIELALLHLDAATVPSDLAMPGYKLHPLTGDRRGFWSIRMTRNWRITFRFEDGNATDIDFEDYH